MGKRATRGKRGRSAVAKQKHWDKLTLKHVEKFIDDIKQNSANSGPSAGNPFEEARQKTLMQTCYPTALAISSHGSSCLKRGGAEVT